MTTLLLSSRHTEDDQALWRAAIGRSWSVERARGIRVPEIDDTEIVVYLLSNSYPLRSSCVYMLWFGRIRVLYGAGSMATDCSSRRKNNFPRALDLRRLKRNVNSSR